jgi:hypothetical protein
MMKRAIEILVDEVLLHTILDPLDLTHTRTARIFGATPVSRKTLSTTMCMRADFLWF